MKYLFAGAGGIGGVYAALFALSEKDVTLMARGEGLAAMKENGLVFVRDGKEKTVRNIRFTSAEDYLASGDHPDVIFVTVKTYSIESVAPFIQDAAGPDTVIIPLMNGICTGDMLAEHVKGRNIIDGCTYIVGMKDGPGRFVQGWNSAKIVFGQTHEVVPHERLEAIRDDMSDIRDVKVELTENIGRETINKFAFVSCMGASALYFGTTQGPVRDDPEKREFFAGLVGEVQELGKKMGVEFEEDLVGRSLKILDTVEDGDTTSMQRDVLAGRTSEFDGQVCEPIRLGEKYGLPMTNYRKVAAKFGK